MTLPDLAFLGSVALVLMSSGLTRPGASILRVSADASTIGASRLAAI